MDIENKIEDFSKAVQNWRSSSLAEKKIEHFLKAPEIKTFITLTGTDASWWSQDSMSLDTQGMTELYELLSRQLVRHKETARLDEDRLNRLLK